MNMLESTVKLSPSGSASQRPGTRPYQSVTQGAPALSMANCSRYASNIAAMSR